MSQTHRGGRNIVDIFWFWIFGRGLSLYLWHFVGFVLRLGVRQENCYLGTFYDLWPHQRLRVSEEAEWGGDSCDTAVMLRTQTQPQNMAQLGDQPVSQQFVNILSRSANTEILVLSETVYLCSSYRAPTVRVSSSLYPPPGPPLPRFSPHLITDWGGMWLIVDTYQVSSLYLRGADLCLNKHPHTRKYDPSFTHVTSQLHTKNISKHISDSWLAWLILAAIILTEFVFCSNYVRSQKVSAPVCRVRGGETQLEKCHI